MRYFKNTRTQLNAMKIFGALPIAIYCVFTGKNFYDLTGIEPSNMKAKKYVEDYPRRAALISGFSILITLPIFVPLSLLSLAVCVLVDVVTHAAQVISAIYNGITSLFTAKPTITELNNSSSSDNDFGLETENSNPKPIVGDVSPTFTPRRDSTELKSYKLPQEDNVEQEETPKLARPRNNSGYA